MRIVNVMYDHRTDVIQTTAEPVEVEESDWVLGVVAERGKIIACRTVTGREPYQYLVEVEYEIEPGLFATSFYLADRT
jgi:hypothetical protein